MHQSIDAPTANTLLRSGHRLTHTCTACDLKVRGAMKPRSICQKSVPQQKSPNEASNHSTRPVITQQDRPQGPTRVTKSCPNSGGNNHSTKLLNNASINHSTRKNTRFSESLEITQHNHSTRPPSPRISAQNWGASARFELAEIIQQVHEITQQECLLRAHTNHFLFVKSVASCWGLDWGCKTKCGYRDSKIMRVGGRSVSGSVVPKSSQEFLVFAQDHGIVQGTPGRPVLDRWSPGNPMRYSVFRRQLPVPFPRRYVGVCKKSH